MPCRLVAVDWGGGFELRRVEVPDVPSGGECLIECFPQESVAVHEVVVGDFWLARVCLTDLLEARYVEAPEQGRYCLEPPVVVEAGGRIALLLRNEGDRPLRSKVAALLRVMPITQA